MIRVSLKNPASFSCTPTLSYTQPHSATKGMVPHKLSLTYDNASDVQLKDLMHNESILFEVRQPLMPDFPINQQNILDMGKWFLERKAPLRGYVGMNKE